MNTQRAPWSDVHVRRAVAYAIDKKGLIQAVGGPAAGVPVPTVITPLQLRTIGSKAAVDKLLSSLPQYPFDLAKAKSELAKSAYPNGFTTTLRIAPLFLNDAQAIAGMLAKIGIKMTVQNVSFSEWLGIASGPRNQVESHLTGFSCDPDPGSTPQAIVDSKSAVPPGLNFADYTNPKADALIAAAREAVKPAQRLVIYGKLLRLLALDMPYVPLISVNADYALSTKFRWPGFNYLAWSGPWALGITAKG
jgi:peptide/nickel transport system substrate-binding protein